MPFYFPIRTMPAQQRRNTLTGLKRLPTQLDAEMPKIMGHYDHIMTDVTEGWSGNDKRFGFIYDTQSTNAE